ncbi:MAG: ABC transporter ATP-binding protein [Nitrospiraceae bacterium]|nr:ABC transporter ATP-binding protein [Nitrospiraceae bacterium]
MNDTLAIETTGLQKTFNATVAVSELNLAIRRGELYGLVGPDGAGKTTTMRLLTGIMTPTAGEARVAGYSVLTDAERIKERIGYMSQRFGLYEDLTVMENILFYADIYEVPRREREPRIERLLGFSNLTPFGDRLAGKLSGGMKQKLGLACALIHTPEILFLDEPTNGVDPVSRRDFWRILYDLLREGVTIFLSTSYLDEAERCGRIGLMHKGKVIIEDQPQNVRASLALPMLEVWTDDVRTAGERVRTVRGVSTVSMYGDRLHIGLAGKDDAAAVLGALEQAGIPVRDHRDILPSLEDVFIAMVEKPA